MAAKIKHEIINGFKICTACQENKAVEDYPKCRKTQTGFGAKCKLCKYIHDNNKRKTSPTKESNIIKARERSKKWRQENPEKYKETKAKYYEENKSLVLEKCKIYRNENSVSIKERKALYNKANSEKINIRTKAWKKQSIELVQANRKRYREKQYKNPSFKLNKNISYGIWKSLLNKNRSHWCDLVGYSLQDLMAHLESKFTIGMTWENYGKDGWEIDHIIPMDLFNHNGDQNHPAFLACWSLDNLQPLWATTLIAIQYGESKSYIGNSNKQHRIKITPEIQSYLDKVNGN